MEPSVGVTSLALKALTSAVWGLLKGPFEEFAKFLFQSAYEVSTNYRTRRDFEGLWRKQLGGYFLYTVNWRKLFLGKEQSTSTVWIKANGGRSFKRVTISVTATLNKIRYQSTIVLYDVSEIPTVASVPSIPLRKIEVRGKMLYVPYDTVCVELKELFDENGKPISLIPAVSSCIHPVDNLEAAMGKRQSDVFRWGRWWSLDFLEIEKKEFHVNFHAMKFEAKFHGSRCSHAWYRLLFWLSERNWFLEACFWSKNLVKAKQLRRAFRRSFAEDI